MRRSALAFLTALLCLAGAAAQATPATQAQPAPVSRVLLVGNSLLYVNHTPALFNAIADQQAATPRWQADMIGAPGGSLSERWNEGVVARELASGRWQALVLQERGGVLACLASPQSSEQPDCQASVGAHKRFIELANKHGVRAIVLGTWGPDALWQGKLGRGLRRVVSGSKAEALDLGPLVRDYGKAHPQVPMTRDEIGHPTLDASLLVAAALYRQLSGVAPEAKALQTGAPMLPPMARMEGDRLLSQQAQLAGDGTLTKVEAERLAPLFAAVAAMPAPATSAK
jgi:hypothetical protein